MLIRARVALLMAILVALFLLLGYAVGVFFFGDYTSALLVALAFALVVNGISYYFCDA